MSPRARMGVVLLFYPQGIPEAYGETTLFSADYHVGCLGHSGSASSFRNAMYGNLENMLPFKTSDISSIRGTTCPLVSRCGTFSCQQGPHQIQHTPMETRTWEYLSTFPCYKIRSEEIRIAKIQCQKCDGTLFCVI